MKQINGALLVTLLSALSGTATAQFSADPYASAQVEHDSNIHRLPNSEASLLLYGDPNLGDTDTRLIAGSDGTYSWGIQKLTGTLEARQIDYEHYTDLNHFEYLANLLFNFKVTSLLDGSVQARQERLAAPFTYNDSTTLEIDTDRNVTAKLNLNFAPEWRLETGANWHVLHAPLQSYPNFVEREDGTHLGLSYLGVANLTYGISIDHIDGHFEEAPDVGAYSQTSAALNAVYMINGLTTLDGALGYTRRTQAGTEDDVSEVTGHVGYTRQLTGKTSLNLQVIRAVNSYLAAGGSEVDTTASLGLSWSATYRLTVNASYGYIKSSFTGQAIPGSTATGRADHSPTEQVNLLYQVLRRLQLKAYYVAQSRSSNDDIYDYSDTTYGVQATLRWR